MSYVKGDRVRMRSNPTQLGTVTGERDQMFLSFVGVQWQSGDFGFVAPSNLEWAGSNMTPAHIEAKKTEPRKKRVYVVELDAADRNATIHANYMRSDDGLVSFWQDVENAPDTLEVAYPLHRIQSITEEL